MTPAIRNPIMLIILGVMAASCTQIPDRATRLATATHEANASHRQSVIATERFDLLTFVPRQTDHSRTDLTIFIEGDGFAWETRYRPSDDPTPIKPLVLGFMVDLDDRPTAYLARPCQYVGATSRNCSPDLWTDGRYGEPVVAALNEAISLLLLQQEAQSVTLIGFSGGGALATLIAARRNDIDLLVTVAAPLDTDAFTAHHNVSQLTDSLNPAGVKPALITIPQIHISGEKDEIVPGTILDAYVLRAPSARSVHIVRVPDATHYSGWPDFRHLLELATSQAERQPETGGHAAQWPHEFR